jgi:hypothetical protein
MPLPQENLGPVYDKALEGLGSWMNVELVKVCHKCREIKKLEEFHLSKMNPDGREGACKECRVSWRRAHRQIPKVKARMLARAKIRNQLPEVKTRRREREKERYVNDPLYRFAKNMRRSVRRGLKGHSKSKRTEKFLYCTFAEALDYLEKKFRSPMTRENMGEVWEVDHIRPICSFDLSDPEQVKACFHYTNLQPLFITENRSKGGRY